MGRMNTLDKIAFWLVIIGGLNWGLIGFFNYNLVNSIFGEGSDGGSTLSRIIYAVVGLSALYLISTFFKLSRHEPHETTRS